MKLGTGHLTTIPTSAATAHLGASVQLFDKQAPRAQVAGGRGEAELDHPVLLLGEEDEELVLLHGHGLQPGGQGRPRLLAHQARVQVNEGQQAVNLVTK